MATCVLILLVMSSVRGVRGLPVPPLPSAPPPLLPVFRGRLEDEDRPEFLAVSRRVTVVEDGTAFLQCSLTGLSPHHLVSWLRLADMSVLTVGGLVFSSDPRLAVTVSPGGRTWQLEISNVSLADGGEYQCQVNTNTRLTTLHHLEVIERPRANPRSSDVDTVEETATPEVVVNQRKVDSDITIEREEGTAQADKERDITMVREMGPGLSDKGEATLLSSESPPTPSASPTSRPVDQSFQVPRDTTSHILLVSMSAFTLVVFAIIAAGCSLGLYRKYKYPELSGGGSRPSSRTGTIDSRRSSGSSGSRRSRRQRDREREENIYSELRVKTRAGNDDIRKHSAYRLSRGSDTCDSDCEGGPTLPPPQLQLTTPTQQRQRVSFNSFRGGGNGRQAVTLASSESLTHFNGQDDSLKPHGKKIRFNPYDEFSD